MIDIRKLKELVRLMVANDITELDLRDTEDHVRMRRPNPDAPVPTVSVTSAAQAPATPAAPPPAAAPAPAASEPDAGDREGLIAIESPMVGTFYAAPNPDASAFVSVGAEVNADTVVCLIEAMKIFNEIKAETSGRIEEICVKNGDAVEFGQPLFYLKA